MNFLAKTRKTNKLEIEFKLIKERKINRIQKIKNIIKLKFILLLFFIIVGAKDANNAPGGLGIY